MSALQATPRAPDHDVPFGEAVAVWARVAALSFGGPAGQIAVMHRILVEEKRWVGERRFLHALNYCMLLPGPEALQLAIYIGWLMHGLAGGLVAGVFFVAPGFVALMALSIVYALYGGVGLVAGAFFGLKAAVLAVVLQAVVRIGRRALRRPEMVAIAVAAFVAIFAFHLPFPLIVLGAAAIGFAGARAGLAAFQGGGHAGADDDAFDDARSRLGEGMPAHATPGWRWSLAVSAVLLVLWLGPVAALAAAPGQGGAFGQIAFFFSKMAVVTFGGAYAVLAYVAQEAVTTYGWLKPGEMLDGLGMAETTPGPLIIVTQFVGFMGAYRNPGGLSPLTAGVLGGALTSWVTFTPCFLWIFLGAPVAERLREARALNGALAAITAAVVGVIANLAIWFALHVVFARVETVRLGPLSLDWPHPASLNPAALVLSVAAALALFRFKLGVIPVLLACAAVGVALRIGGVA
ncbi:MAG: chromate efflux transporter [Phenylobacterium sp.]